MAVAEIGEFVLDGITDVEVEMREEMEVRDISNVVVVVDVVVVVVADVLIIIVVDVVEMLVVVTSIKDTVLDKELEGDGLCGFEE